MKTDTGANGESTVSSLTKTVIGAILAAIALLIAERTGLMDLVRGPSIEEQWAQIREDVARDPPGDAPPIRVLETARVDFRGSGSKSYLMIIGADEGRRAPNELRIYDVADEKLKLSFTFGKNDGSFEIADIDDYNGDGQSEVLGGIRVLQGMGPSYLHPTALGWDDSTGSYQLRPVDFGTSSTSSGVETGIFVMSDPNGTQMHVELHAAVLDWDIVRVDGVPVLITVYDPYPKPVSHVAAWKLVTWRPQVEAERCSKTREAELVGDRGLGEVAGRWWQQSVGRCKEGRPDLPLPG